jgi:hypothetical protein
MNLIGGSLKSLEAVFVLLELLPVVLLQACHEPKQLRSDVQVEHMFSSSQTTCDFNASSGRSGNFATPLDRSN